MIKIENVEVMGWEHAIRGARNPMNSWEKSDTYIAEGHDDHSDFKYLDHIEGATTNWMTIGPNDHKLMMSLAKGGPVHAKYRRMIMVYADITAPLYWWKEFDTYRVGVEKNSCSTMHKIHEKEFTLEDFSHEHLDGEHVCANIGQETLAAWDVLYYTIKALNYYREKYLEAKTKPMKEEGKRAELMKKYWWQMIQLLPSSYNQRRTVMMSYEALAAMRKDRKHHKQDEWRFGFCPWIESLPYSEIITVMSDKEEDND